MQHRNIDIAFFIPHFRPPGKNLPGFGFFLWFRWSIYKSAKYQLSNLSRSGLAFLNKHTKIHMFMYIWDFRSSREKFSWFRIFPFGLGGPSHKCAKFKLSTLSGSGLAFLDKHRIRTFTCIWTHTSAGARARAHTHTHTHTHTHIYIYIYI
jgi:hypothetical protein